MKTPARIVAAICVAGAALLLAPGTADAQGRRGGRVVRSRPAVVAGAYYQPFFYDPWYFSPYSQWYPPYYGYGGAFDVSGSLRLQVEPRETEVFVDGYFAGTVDEFDGFFQRLHLEPGEHDLQLYLRGHRTVQRKIYLQPGRTFKVHQTMTALAPGEAEPAKPTPRQLPSAGASSGPSPTRPSPRGPSPTRPAPRRSPERAPSTESGFGSLTLRVQPGDTVITIDGDRWEGGGDDERLVIQLGAGVHRVEIRKDGYRTYSTDVTVRGGEPATLNVALTRE